MSGFCHTVRSIIWKWCQKILHHFYVTFLSHCKEYYMEMMPEDEGNICHLFTSTTREMSAFSNARPTGNMQKIMHLQMLLQLICFMWGSVLDSKLNTDYKMTAKLEPMQTFQHDRKGKISFILRCPGWRQSIIWLTECSYSEAIILWKCNNVLINVVPGIFRGVKCGWRVRLVSQP
jgi:hypothetical protein